MHVDRDVLDAWRPVHRVVQHALAIVASRDARMRALSVWPGEEPSELGIRPGLACAAEGGVSIRVRHARLRSEALGGSWFLDTRHSDTRFRLLGYAVACKDGDIATWHATTLRMAELVEEFAATFAATRSRTPEARVRAAARAMSGLSPAAYRGRERRLAAAYAHADELWLMLRP